MKYISGFLKLSLGFERLCFFIFTFFVLSQILTCLWVMMASLENDQDYEGTWISPWMESYYQEPINKYILSFYWACNTITTVRYGNFSGKNEIEMVFCTIVEVFGVVGFAFASSSLTSILTNYDKTNSWYQAKLQTLNNIYKRYKLPFRLAY